MNFEEIISTYKHRCHIQIRYKDIDKQGHVNNAVHLTYFETARSNYFKKVLRKKNDWVKTGIILASTSITYKLPILLEDDLFCYTKISHVGTKSFEIEHLLAVETSVGLTLVAYGKSTMVCYDYDIQKTIEIPEQWLMSINEFEN